MADKPLYETTTSSGDKIRVEGPAIGNVMEKVQSLQEGELPSNKEIESGIEKAKETLRTQSKETHLSPQGAKLEKDMEEVLESGKNVWMEKNKEEKLQELIKESKAGIAETSSAQLSQEVEGAKGALGTPSEELKKETKELFDYIKNLSYSFLRSEEFRYLLADWVQFIQFLTTQKLIETTEQTTLQTKQAIASPEESKITTPQQKQEVTSTAQQQKKEVIAPAEQKKEIFGPAEQKKEVTAPSEQKKEVFGPAEQKKEVFGPPEKRETISEKEQKQEVVENVGAAIIKGIQQPEKPASQQELEERTEQHFQDLLTRISSQPEYKKAVEDSLKLWDNLRDYLDNVSNRPPVETEHFKKALNDAETILANFTGRKEMDSFKNQFWNVYTSFKNDDEVWGWFRDVRGYIENTLRDPETKNLEERKQKARMLSERGRLIFNKEKYRDQINELNNQLNLMLNNISNDSTTKDFGDKLQKLARDFALNAQGYPDLFVMEESMTQLQHMVVPLFRNLLANIPINRVEVLGETYDAKLENILIDANTFLPEKIEFRMLNASHIDLKHSERDLLKHQILLQVDNIKPVFKDLKFYYKRKSFPKIEDYGMADVAFGGEGALLRVIWTIEKRGHQLPKAILTEVKCDIDKLNIHVNTEVTKHDILDTIMAPIVSSSLKSRIADMIEGYIRDKLNETNNDINQWLHTPSTSSQWKMKADQALKQAFQRQQPTVTAT